MSVMRVEKNSNYTVMANYHLRDKGISLKAKGLLSVMLSLPAEWDYTLAGLAHISKEGVDAIGTAVKELEYAGYVVRTRRRNEAGQLLDTDYTIYEFPQKKKTEEANANEHTVFCHVSVKHIVEISPVRGKRCCCYSTIFSFSRFTSIGCG